MNEKKLSPIAGKKLIIDTDIGPDCDDAGALAVAFQLAKEYGVTIAGVCNCTSNPYGAGAVDAIASYFGAGDIAIGEYRGSLRHLPDYYTYNKVLTEEMSEKYKRGELRVCSHLELYHDILSESGDGEVVLLLIGQFNALADVMKAYPSLVRDKVCGLVSMAGQFPKGREYNIFTEADSARYVLSRFGAPVVFSGFEVGEALVTGFTGEPDPGERNPVRRAYFLYDPSGRRFSWDLTAAEYCIAGENGRYALSGPGFVTVGEDGSNTFAEDPAGNHRYLRLISDPAEHIAFFDGLLAGKKKG